MEAKEGNVNILNAMDSNYSYYYHMQEKFDVAGALANITTAVAVGALTGGAGAAALAGLSSSVNSVGMNKGNMTIEENYDESIVNSVLLGNNINIKSKEDVNLVSVIINDNNIENINDINNLDNVNLA